jgi:hypothetical protein
MLDEHAQELASIAKYKAVELSQASDNIAETFDLSNPQQLLSEVPLSDALRDCVSGAKSAKVIAMLASHIHSNVTNGVYKVVMNGMPGSPDLETAIPMMIPSELLVANENTTFSEFIEYIEKVSSWTKLALVVFNQYCYRPINLHLRWINQWPKNAKVHSGPNLLARSLRFV